MIERIIENWLTNSTERVYQIPFAQLLGLKGHRIKYLSKHGVAEHGKDIVSVDPDNNLFAYQLKTGDLNAFKWTQIKREIDDLIELPVQYPSGETAGSHNPVLVTNGSITDDVRLRVQALNEGNERRGLRPLSVVTGKELLQDFVKAHGSFLPSEPRNIRSLLELYMGDGRANLPENQFADFVNSLFSENIGGRQNQLRQITSALLLSKYAAFPYDCTLNHVSIIKAWVIFLAHMYRYVEAHECKPSVWHTSEEIVFSAIEYQLGLLKAEVLKRHNKFIEGSSLGDGGWMYQVRVTIVLGLLASMALKSVYNVSA